MSEIDAKYNLLGGTTSFLGGPVDIERPTPNGLGSYRHYQGGSIYWHHAFPSEAFVVRGLIKEKWSQIGWEQSPLGFPVSDELPAGDLGGKMSLFDGGAILYRPDLGTHEIHGAIFHRWRDLGDINRLGFPLTDELTTPDTRGRYNHSERGSIYWTPQTDAWEVSADIKDVWARGGWEQGPVGYPVSSSGRMPGVLTDFQDFERGTIYAFGPNSKTLVRPKSVFATTEHFITWGNFGKTSMLPDGDIITVTFSQNFPQFGIHITLNMGPGVGGWKALSLFTPNRGDLQQTLLQGNSTTTIEPSIFDAGDVYVHFGKEKTFGLHTGIYFLERAT